MFLDQNTAFESYAPVWERQLRIQSTALRMGHFVSRLDREWSSTPFIIQGFQITTVQDLNWIKQHCHWVVIDLQRSQVRPADEQKNRPVAELRGSEVNQESMKIALRSYVGLERNVRDILKDLRAGQFLTNERMKRSLNEIAEQLFDHGPALIWLTHIKSQDNYTAEHCINVAIMAMGLAHSLGWSDDKIQEAGLAGLLHDAGKILVPTDILNKAGALNESEFREMKLHTSKGFELITQDPQISDNVRKAALHHHERPDGNGYPHGLNSHQIPEVAALVSIVDAYDAITSNRCYQRARNHHQALKILWQGRGSQFHPEMVETFIRWIGWVSPGTVVRLNTGEKAIVIQSHAGKRLQPTVRLVIETDTQTLLGPVQDLATLSSDDLSVYIADVLDAAEANIDMRDMARQMLFEKQYS